MRYHPLFLALVLLSGAAEGNAETVWILQTGPEAVTSIPLDPVQPVSAWRGGYSDGDQVLSLYVTRSPQFFSPQSADVATVLPTPWTVVVFFPPSWGSEVRRRWLETWMVEFRTLATLPDPGYPIVFPAILRKG